MSAIRQFVISAIVFAVLPPAVVRASDTVEYVGGTVKSIPLNATGALSFADGKEMRFNYGQGIFKLGYEQISSTEIVQGETMKHVFHKIPIPSFGHAKQTLSIKYKDPAGGTGTLEFEMSARLAADARETIVAMQEALQSAGSNQPMEWWGDRYWKTNRNKSTWDTPPVTAQSGTKE